MGIAASPNAIAMVDDWKPFYLLWDLSIGLLVLTSVFCLFRHIWVETIMMRKELWNLVESFGAYIKDVWQDKLIRKKLWNLVEPLGVYINDVWQDKLFAFTLIAILVSLCGFNNFFYNEMKSIELGGITIPLAACCHCLQP